MKILLLNQEHASFGGPGGAERSVQSIANYFVQAGHEVTLLAMIRRSYMRDMPESGIHSIHWIEGVKTILVGRANSRYSHADLLLPIILSEQPDIIHTNVFHRAPQVWKTLAPLGIPILHTLREYKLMCDRNLFNGVSDCGSQCVDCSLISNYAVEMAQNVDGVVGISTFTLQRHLERGFFPNATVKRVIPNSHRPKGVPLPHVTRPSGTPVRIGFLGRLHASKGINLIVDVFKKLPPDAAALVMAGDLQDAEIASRVQQLGATHNARYIGFVEPATFFPNIDVLLAPSIWHEPFGRITIEAFAHGVPVITTNRGGLPDIVTDGKTGWIFDPDRPEELSDILSGLRDVSEERWQELRKAASEAALRYTPDIVGEQYLECYRELIASKAEATPKTAVALRALYERDATKSGAQTRLHTNLPYRVRRPLRVLIVTGEFPKLSETFVLNHITGLLDLGLDVQILYSRAGRADQVPAEFYAYKLQERATLLEPPERDIQAIRELTKPARAAAARLSSARVDGVSTEAVETARKLLETSNQPMIEYRSLQAFETIVRDVDIVHCHFGHRPKYIFRYMDLCEFHPPVVCSFHGIDVSAHVQRWGENVYDNVKHRLHRALPVSNFFRQRLISYGFEPTDVAVHHVGIDMRRFEFMVRQRAPDEMLNLLSVGRLVFKKGFAWAIQAVARARQLRPDMRFHYCIVGEGSEEDNLQRLIAELDVRKHVTLVGARPHSEVISRMREAHALVTPSVTGPDGDMEGIPTVTMEAMACGLPVFSTFHSGIPEAVVHGYCGLLSNERDAEGLAANFIRLYDDPALGARFGRQGRSHVEREFNIERQNKKLVQLYTRIVHGEHF